MSNKIPNSFFLCLVLFCLFPSFAFSQTQIGIISLSESLGSKIDSLEQQRYHLFPDIKGFQSAQIEKLSETKYRITFTYQDEIGSHRTSRTVSKKAVDLTKLHIKLTDEYLSLSKEEKLTVNLEAEMLYRLSLKYASQKKYEISSRLMNDLVSGYSQTSFADSVEKYYNQTNRLWKTKEALFWRGSLLDQSGRTETLIFSGYYGLWLGIATPIFLEAESSQAYALGLLLGGPVSVLIANSLTKEANISDSKSTLISLGGHLGTWQGIGWAIVGDMDGGDVVGLGEIGGLAGILGATLLANKTDFSLGHAEITSSGLQWGAWFGLVLGIIANLEDDDLLKTMLIGSDALILGAGVTAKNVQMSRARVRLINLAGIIGAVFGFGVDLLLEVDDASTAFAIAGLGSAVGLAWGTSITKNLDKRRELTLLGRNNSKLCYCKKINGQQWTVFPKFSFRQNPAHKEKLIPTFGLQMNF